MRAIGISEYEVENIVKEMVSNGEKYGVVATYHKGIAAYIEPIDDSTDWFRIIPYTKEQWKQASSLNLIPISSKISENIRLVSLWSNAEI